MKSSFKTAVIITCLLAAVISTGCTGTAFKPDGFEARSVKVGNVEYAYRVYIPPGREAGKKLPVMLYLHGANRRGDDNVSQVLDLADTIRKDPRNFDFIIVFPQCRVNTFWAGPMAEQALAALDSTVEEFGGDPDRLYLAGYSMGGFGAFQMAVTYPERFAAVVPIAGGIEPQGKVSAEDMALLSPTVRAAAEAPDPYAAFAQRLAKTPLWIVHGAGDDVVPVAGSQKISEALRAAGNQDVTLNLLEGVGHGAVGPAFSDSKLFDWLKTKRRETNR